MSKSAKKDGIKKRVRIAENILNSEAATTALFSVESSLPSLKTFHNEMSRFCK